MKAAVCRGFGAPLAIEDVALRAPQGSEVEVEIAACAICHSDIHFIDGDWGGRLPAIFGHEAAGTVTRTGPEARGLAPGDRVAVTLLRSCGGCHYCRQGNPHLCETKFPLDRQTPLSAADGAPIAQGLRTAAFAEAVVVEQSQVAKIPPDLAFEPACLLSCGVLTGFGAVVNTAAVPAGASVAVVGTGGVGLNCLQGAALSGAAPIIAVDLADAKLEAARRFGATHTVNAAQQDAAEEVRRIAGGRGADFVFVAVGSAKAVSDGLALVANGGALVVVGMPASGAMSAFEPADFAYRSQRILGSRMGSARLATDLPRLVAAYQDGRLKLDELITASYPLDRINEAIASTRSGSALRNVIVF